MSQSSVLVGLLVAMFLLFIAAKGRLPVYTSVLWGKKSSGSGSSGGDSGDKVETAAKVAVKFLPYVLA